MVFSHDEESIAIPTAKSLSRPIWMISNGLEATDMVG
jgi:hypothetical protein